MPEPKVLINDDGFIPDTEAGNDDGFIPDGFQTGDPNFKPGAFGQVMGGIQNALAAPVNAVLHPVDTNTGLWEAQVMQAALAKQAWDAGDLGTAFRKSLAAITPIAGPMIENTADKFTEEGKYRNPDVQGGRPWEAATDLTLSALPLPLKTLKPLERSGATGAAASVLKGSARRSYAQALAPTKQQFKNLTNRVVEGTPGTPGVPGLVERGVTALTRPRLKQTFDSMVETVGDQIDQMQAQIPQGSKYIPLNDAINAINQGAEEAFTIPVPQSGGSIRPLPTGPMAEAGMKVASKLTKALEEASETLPSGQRMIDYQLLRRFRQAWDESVAKAGGFAGTDLINNARMRAYQEATNGIRGVLNSATPDIAALNREFSFWKNAQSILEETIKRTAPQSEAMGQQMARVAGQAAGMASGGIGAAILTGETLRNLRKLTTSTAWKTTGAVLKDRLANAVAAGDNKLANALIASALLKQAAPPITIDVNQLNPQPMPPQ